MFHIYDPNPEEMVRKISKIKNDFIKFASKLVTEYHTLFNSKYKETLEYVNKLEKATGIKLSQQMKIALNIIRMEICQ
jgi:predicted metallo-beta-lactamase superfamily hydrolase